MKFTEEDLRTKVIYTWLKDLGFEDSQLQFEKSFKINLGKYTYKVKSSSEKRQEIAYPRTDILVKDNDKNLLIIEVKEPNHKLNEDDKLQAISYARLLPQIAPFTILTNGKETIIYDSVTTEQLKEQYIPNSHPYVKNNFKVTAPDLGFYNRALETFIGLSKENLLAFCEIQVQESMSLLKSEDINSGKKYIPSLYIQREKQEKALIERIEDKNNKLIFVTGSPQHGKTSFVCNFIENLLEKGQPCIFYPAINIQNSLFDELELDFKWLLSDNSSIHSILTHKIQNILLNTNSRLFIFLDGLNEADLGFIGTLNKDFSRLKNLNITFIVSFTNITAKRLLIDKVNNVTELANYLSLSNKDIMALEIDSDNIHKNIITIAPYSEDEAKKALQKYSEIYRVQIETDKLFYDPFLLRTIMSYYENKIFYGDVDEVELLRHYIQQKEYRTKELDEVTIETILENISNDILEKDAPLLFKNILKYTETKSIEPLFESALLARTLKDKKLYIEFYNEREQCYFISTVREWDKKFETYDSFALEANHTLKTNAGKLALSWYIKVNPYIIKEYWEKLFVSEYYEVQSSILFSLAEYISKDSNKNDIEWLYKIVEKGIASKSKKIITESLKLIPLLFEHLDQVPSSLDIELLIAVILDEESENIESDAYDMINYKTLKFLHEESGGGLYHETIVTLALEKLISEKYNKKALEALGHCQPFLLIEFLAEEPVEKLKILVNDTLNVIDYMEEELEYFYDGHYMGCPGFFTEADKQALISEYESSLNYYNTFSKLYTNQGLLDHFKKIMDSCKYYLDKNFPEEDTIEEKDLIVDHPNQTYMDFDNL